MRTTNRRFNRTRTTRRAFFESLEGRSLMAVVSYWSGDNTAVDPVSGNNGTLQNGATYSAGQLNQSFRLDGIDDRVLVADSPSLEITRSLSIEAWICVDGYSTTLPSMIVFRGDDRVGLDPYQLNVQTDGTLLFRIKSAAGPSAQLSANIPKGEFVHVTGTLDDATGEMSLYENGVLVANLNTPVRPFGTLDPTQHPGLGIGNGNWNYNVPFHGLVDELKIYDHALTSAEVLANFNATKTTISISDATATEGAVSYRFGNAFVNAAVGGLDSPRSVVFHDGDLFVASAATSSILRYDGDSGAFLGPFVTSGSGGLDGPFDLAFGPDGNLFVTSYDGTYTVIRYDGTTGAFLDTFVGAGSGGLGIPTGLAFDAAGDLLVSSYSSGQILKYQGPTKLSPGSSMGVFANTGTGSSPDHLVFGPDGSLFVGATGHATPTPYDAAILRYNGVTGASLGTYVPTGRGGLQDVRQMVFDATGNLLLADPAQNALLVYQGPAGLSPGAYLGQAVSPGLGGLNVPIGVGLGPDGRLYVSSRDSDQVLRYEPNGAAMFIVSLSAPSSQPVTVNYNTANGSATAGSDFAGASGTVTFAPGQTSGTILVQTTDDGLVETSEGFSVTLSNAVGAAIVDGTGLGTIQDDDASRTISISDATATEGPDHARLIDIPISSTSSPLSEPRSIVQGPTGDFFVTSSMNKSVLRYDGTTLQYKSTFVPAGSGGLDFPVDLVFANGDLFVSSGNSGAVLRYNGQTGSFLGQFAPAGAQGMNRPTDLLVHDGLLYISDWSGSIFRYDLATGLFVDKFVTGLNDPVGMAFAPDGSFLVGEFTPEGNNAIFRYDGNTGAPLGEFVPEGTGGMSRPAGMKYGPDGALYVVDMDNDRVLRFNGTTGAFIDAFVSAGQAGMDGPTRLMFLGNQMFVTCAFSNQVVRFGAPWELFTVTLSSPSANEVTVNYSHSTVNGTATVGSDFESASGVITFAPGQTSQTILVQLANDNNIEVNETFGIELSNESGGVIGDGTGVGTISDDDTKFYVVDDAGANRTFEYGTGGPPSTNTGEDYALASGNTTPRGAASTATGDKVWVVDANKSVYVYSNSGTLLGSWAAGTIPGSPDIQGVTTNGTDVWIVDAKSDKVYRYAGAASRLAGSQNAASSFALNKNNTNPKDLVTDGSSIWVVDDASTDKVYKYSLSGSLVTSWTIQNGGGNPTGITLDPSPGSTDLWIVDNGASIDRIYLLPNGRTNVNNPVNATNPFQLVTGNSNPQGIADPPVGAIMGPAKSPATTTANSAFDSALLAIAAELDSRLASGRKRK